MGPEKTDQEAAPANSINDQEVDTEDPPEEVGAPCQKGLLAELLNLVRALLQSQGKRDLQEKRWRTFQRQFLQGRDGQDGDEQENEEDDEEDDEEPGQ